MIPIEISKPSFQVTKFSPVDFKEGIRANLDMVDKVRECSRIIGEALTRQMELRRKNKVISVNVVIDD